MGMAVSSPRTSSVICQGMSESGTIRMRSVGRLTPFPWTCILVDDFLMFLSKLLLQNRSIVDPLYRMIHVLGIRNCDDALLCYSTSHA